VRKRLGFSGCAAGEHTLQSCVLSRQKSEGKLSAFALVRSFSYINLCNSIAGSVSVLMITYFTLLFVYANSMGHSRS